VVPRQRLDQALVERGLAGSRSQALGLVLAGRVLVDGAPVTKAGAPVPPSARVELTQAARYVSRGGEKLRHALDELRVDVRGERCLDVGASTGGFTDCLLQAGAEHVVALDVGRGLLHERLLGDARVTLLERVNARDLDAAPLPYSPTVVTIDVSFISLRLVLPAAVARAAPAWRVLALVKPQFEAGREHVRKGVVRDRDVRVQVLRRAAGWARDAGGNVLGVCDSSLPGPAGNREYFLLAASAAHPLAGHDIDIDAAIEDATRSP
jgi:23S rRNA (cytidine1920-2'-O)/16S rRNA (cytidine1409-2'-O)-methyltransferase